MQGGPGSDRLPGGFAWHTGVGRARGSDRRSLLKEGCRLTYAGDLKSSGKLAADQGAGCGCQGQDALCCAEQPACSGPHLRGNTGKAEENPSPGRVAIGEPVKKTLNFKYFLRPLPSAQRMNPRLTPAPSPALPTQRGQSQAGLERVREEGREPPSRGTAPWPSHFASFCSSFPTRKMGRLFTYLPQAGQQLMSVCKALPAP